jgi:hypothetical protein
MVLTIALRHCTKAAGNTLTRGVFSVFPERSAGIQKQGQYNNRRGWKGVRLTGYRPDDGL